MAKASSSVSSAISLIMTRKETPDFSHAAGARKQENTVTVRDDDFVESHQASKEIRQCVRGPDP